MHECNAGTPRTQWNQRPQAEEPALHRREQELEARVALLELQLQEAQANNARMLENFRLQNAFFATVAHDLRTPMTSIFGYAKLVRRDIERAILPFIRSKSEAAGAAEAMDKAKRTLANLQVMHAEGDRLTRLINNLLDLNKIEAGQAVWRDRLVNIADCIYEALLSVAGQFADKPDVNLQANASRELPVIRVDPDRIAQVLVNLLHNAAKFTERGHVEISALVVETGHLEICVRDTGTGIPPEELPRIFDLFQQACLEDTLQGTRCGTGLGLAICRQIVEHYGGQIWAESQPGQGSTFRFQLPIQGAQHA
ncbi:sensor histidine kinase [Megalodesulfovibrio gigas]|nr:HAMP domain-containing sensor histidine kinase [Megalodesulfovibrio gigas]